MVGKAAGKTTGKNFGMTEAVSPVVGVMLMLVVTIVIAAVVSGFSTGIMGDKKADLPGKISFHGIAGGGTDPVLGRMRHFSNNIYLAQKNANYIYFY